jgi:hypothetical protein
VDDSDDGEEEEEADEEDEEEEDEEERAVDEARQQRRLEAETDAYAIEKVLDQRPRANRSAVHDTHNTPPAAPSSSGASSHLCTSPLCVMQCRGGVPDPVAR